MKKTVASVVIGAFLWFVLMFIHAEWSHYSEDGWPAPPPFDPFNVWTLAALIAGTWLLLRALLRWADRQLEEPV